MKQEIRERIEKIQKDEVPEGYRKTKVGIIPIAWGVVPTNKVLKTVKKAVNVEPNTEYREIGIRSHGKGIFHKKLVQGNKLGNKRVFWVEEKCFIVNIVFAWEQAVAITSENERGLIASHRFPMYKPKTNNLDLNYIHLFYKSPRGKHQLELASPGGAGRNKTLGQKEFAKSIIPLPPISEQKKIVSICCLWDKYSTLILELINEKEKFKNEITEKLLTNTLRFKNFQQPWIESNLGKLGTIKTSSVDKKFKSGQKEVFLLNYLDVYNNKIINDKMELSKTTTNKKQLDTSIIEYGDVLFTPSSEIPSDIGHSAVFMKNSNDTLFSYHLVRLRFEKEFNIYFKAYVFNARYIKKEFAKRSVGVTRSVLSIGEFGKSYIKYPSDLNEQKKIGLVLKCLDDELFLLRKKFIETQKQKKFLTQLLLMGIVRVEVD